MKTSLQKPVAIILFLLIAPWVLADNCASQGSKAGCSSTAVMSAKPATAATIAAQKDVMANLPKDDGRDEAWARQGFIGTLADPVSRNAKGEVVYDPNAWKWVEGEAPATVNPSLWRHMKIINTHGLFKVAEGVWQVRGLDPTNVTIIRGDKGWVIIDPMMTDETARTAMKLVNKYLGKRPITGIVYTHSHVDHFGGVYGVLGDQQTIPPILAPEHFLEATGSEWVLAGNIMTRRGSYQWGQGLKAGAEGYVGTGFSMQAPKGTIRLIPPSDTISKTGETRTLDGVQLEFQMVPETEAVSEMNIFIPQHRTLLIPEFATCTMHNIQTPRGAQARDALQWAEYITEAIRLFGDSSDAMIHGHCWPRFGNKAIKDYLLVQRDNYKYLHDQTVRMMNLGYTPSEAAEAMKPPKAISDEWATHGYYGHYGHNAKGVYQYYVGWWDGIPAHLNMHPTEEQARRYVELIGADKIMKAAQTAFDQGDYRWSAELLNHLVFADPDNRPAKALLADSYEQMGYQEESAVFRNIYLSGAAELRGRKPPQYWLASADLTNLMGTSLLFDLVAARLNPEKVTGQSSRLLFHLTDTDETVLLSLENSVLVNEVGQTVENPDVEITATRNLVRQLFLQKVSLDALKEHGLAVTGNVTMLARLQDAVEQPPTDYPVVTP